MNLFAIPSWYPNALSPLSGIFIQEQIQSIAELSPDVSIFISTWGHDQGFLNPRKPGRAFLAVFWRCIRRPGSVSLSENLTEVFHPALSWSNHLSFIPMSDIISANRKNLEWVLANKGKVDLIHAHVSYPAGYVATILSKEFDIPYVITEHMGPFPFSSLLCGGRPRREISQAIDNASATIAVSDALADEMVSFGYARPLVIPNMVDDRRYILGAAKGGRFRFLTLSRLDDKKGIDHLLRSIASWNPSSSDVEFYIGGDGPMRKQYEALARKLKIDDRVRWLGVITREQAPDLFKESNAFVLPSLHESFGIVYAEAVACGKPVIATRCGGPESIINEANGLLVEIGNVEQLANSLKKIYTNWNFYDPNIIREDFLNKFSRTVVVSKLLDVYKKTIGIY